MIAKLALLAIAAAQPTEQFDLVCSGQVTSLALGAKTTAPYTRRLRVDLGAGQWCADACLSVEPIARIEPGRLVLREVKRDTPREYWVERETVDRVTGEHSSMAENSPFGPNPRSAFSSGKCQLTDFSGFVSKATRF